MAMTTSELSIIVQSKGIKEATADLTNLAKAASSVDAETKAFVIAQQKLNAESTKTSKSAELLELRISRQKQAMEAAQLRAERLATANANLAAKQDMVANNKLVAELEKQAAASERAAKAQEKHGMQMEILNNRKERGNQVLAKHAQGLDEVTRRGNVYVNTLRSMATAALAYVGVNFFTGVVKEADAWSLMQSKLKLAVGSMEGAKVAQKDLFEMSQRLRVPIEDTAKLFTRMAIPLQKMGQTTSDVKKVVESFSMALKLGGATGQEASSAMLQLSQSFNAGRLNGGEFNSVAEAAPSVLRALEVELVRVGKGADLARYGLKELAAKGVLSTQIMAEALKRAAPQWEEDFKQLPLTFDGAMTRIKNAWQKAVGEVGEDTKFNQKLAESLKKLEDMLPSVAKAIGNAFIFMVENAQAMVEVLKVLAATFVLIKLGAFLTLLLEARAAFIAAETATLGFVAALKLLHLTPLGLLLLGVAAAGTVLYNAFKDYNKETERTIENNAKMAQNGDLLKAMEAETLELKKQADASRIKAGLDAIYSDDIKRATKAYTEEEKAILAVRLAKDGLQATQLSIRAMNKRMGMENLDSPATEPMRKELASAVALVKDAESQVDKIREKTRSNDNIRSQEALVQWGNERNAIIENARVAALTKNQIALDARNKAKKLLEEDKVKYDLTSNEAGLAAIRNRELKIERDYQEALDKIKSTKAEKDEEKYKALRQSTLEYSDSLEELKVKLLELEKYGIDDKRTQSEKEKTKLQREYLREADQVIKAEKAKQLAMAREKVIQEDLIIAETKRQKSFQDNVESMTKEADSLEKSAEQQKMLLQAYGKTEGELFKLRAEKEENKLTDMAQRGVNDELLAQQQRIVDALKRETAARDELGGKKGTKELADKYESDYQAANKRISDGLYNAIGKGGESAVKKLIQDMKSWFARLVLNPIIEPISQFGASIIAPNSKSATEGIDFAKSFDKIAGSFTSLSDTVTKGVQTIFDKAGLSMTEGAPSTFAQGAGTVAGYGAGIAAGVYGGRAISAGYSVGDHGNALVNIGTAAGAIIAGPIGAAIGGAIAGGINRTFGMKEKEFAAQTVTGNLGTSDLTRNQAWTQAGGFLRSDRSDTWKYQLSNSTATTSDGKSYQDTASLTSDKALLNQLNAAYDAIKLSSSEYTKALGINADSIKQRTDAINFTFGKTTQETAENIGKAFDNVSNAIASDMLGNLKQLALQNETSSQTMIRLATNISSTNGMFKALGYNLFKLDVEGIKAADAIVTLFGGLDKFQSIASDYYDKFYLESEKSQVKVDAMTKSLKELGKELPTSRAAFREMVEAAQKAGNNELYVALMKLSSGFAEITEATEEAASKVKGLPESVKETFDTLTKSTEKWLSLRTQASSLKEGIDDALGNKKDPAARIKQLWASLSADVSPEQKMALATELKDLLISKYQVEKESVQNLIAYGKQLKTYTESLKLGSLSTLTTEEKLVEAQKQYQDTLTKAQAGDTIAQGALQGKADSYLQIAQTALASSGGYASIFNNITSTLEALGVQASSATESGMQLEELKKLREFAVATETTANLYYANSLKALTDQLNVMNALYIKIGDMTGLSTIIANLPAEIAASIKGQVGTTSNEDFVKSLYASYAGKFGSDVDAEGMAYWMSEVAKFGKEFTTVAFMNSAKVLSSAPTQASTNSEVATLKEAITVLTAKVETLTETSIANTDKIVMATVTSNMENADKIVQGTNENKLDKQWNESLVPALD